MGDTDNKTDAQNKKVVLIIEDDQFLVRLYQLELAKKGLETWVATDGATAVALLAKESPNAVLLDLMLPGGMNGFDVLSAIRANEKWKNVPVIIVSNLGQEEDMKRAETLGVKDYTIKANMHLNDIIERVAKYVG